MKGASDIDSILDPRAGPRRTAAIASWLQSHYPVGARRPILVGGAAVELYTGGAYTTGDLDFVGEQLAGRMPDAAEIEQGLDTGREAQRR